MRLSALHTPPFLGRTAAFTPLVLWPSRTDCLANFLFLPVRHRHGGRDRATPLPKPPGSPNCLRPRKDREAFGDLKKHPAAGVAALQADAGPGLPHFSSPPTLGATEVNGEIPLPMPK